MARVEVVSVDILMECFDLDPMTGTLRWKVRPRHHFSTDHGWRTTNGRSAGRIAGAKCKKGYLQVEVAGVAFKVHRVVYAMATGSWPNGEIDHINGDPEDNRPENLRDVSGCDNMKNKGVYKRNASGHPNISLRPEEHLKKRWHVQIVFSGIKYQAYFGTLAEAKQWRDRKRGELGFHPNHGQRPGYSKSKGSSE